MSVNFLPIKSSNLEEAAYDAADRTLRVRFRNGGVYEYPDVSPETWSEFSATFQTEDSTGQFFHKHLRGRPFRKL